MTQANEGTNQSINQLQADASELIATLKAKLVEAESLQSRIIDVFNAAESKSAEIGAIATAALAAKTQITDGQAVISTKSSHIQDAQIHADAVRAELDRLQTVVTQKATETEGQYQRAEAAKDAAAEALAEIRAHKTAAEADATVAASSRDAAEAAAAASKKLADKAETVEKKITAYENRLAELDNQCNEKLETITGLLPGATAAGLAHAFDDRRKTFLKPGTRWQWLFVGSVSFIVLLALTGLWHVYKSGTPLTWDELARLWVARLPIAGALVWLALHASRESALAKRLEEDYGYKAAIAASFQGFQKQMADLGSSVQESSPLSKLCGDTLATIASPPGRIYEKHQLTVTASGELAAAAAEVMKREKVAK
ncbi:hypothetical protein [Diaphorobacter sp.]|uniref:hypothetical protein n=1 Tax=Diaphorobacter sp. TaxID=1934310 RepID=UPI00258A5095|nr:hypothetical protein [Diaphorobacter sp.]